MLSPNLFTRTGCNAELFYGLHNANLLQIKFGRYLLLLQIIYLSPEYVVLCLVKDIRYKRKILLFMIVDSFLVSFIRVRENIFLFFSGSTIKDG